MPSPCHEASHILILTRVCAVLQYFPRFRPCATSEHVGAMSTSAIRKILGCDNVLGSKKTEVDVTSLDGKPVMLYFSAGWCPPCRQFTPILSKLYKKKKAAKVDFDIVFVSADRSQEEFDEYFKEHPWLALPYSARKQKDKLVRKFKASSLPTLVILDKEGRLISSRGRQAVMQDQEGKEFPWIPKSVWEIMKNAELTRADGAKVAANELESLDHVALYFSAHWCPPCRSFTPRLASVYRKLKTKNTSMEVIFVSMDQAEEEYTEYLSEMPWPALKLGDSRIQELVESVGVEGLPTLVTVKRDGTVVNKDAKEVADDDEAGGLFPWAPVSLPKVCPLNPSQPVVHALNNDVCVILSVNGAPNRSTALDEFHAAVNILAEEVNSPAEPEDHIRFLTVDDTDDAHVSLYRKVLSATGSSIPKHGDATVLMMNLPNKQALKFVAGELSRTNIVQHVKAFKRSQED